MSNIVYTDIAAVQKGNVNWLGSLNDPLAELANAGEILAQYTMIGNETTSSLIYIAKLKQGMRVSPTYGNVAGNGIASTATLKVGDTDTVGGTVSADASRYSAAIDVHADGSAGSGVTFAGGTALIAPAKVTDDGCWLTGTFATLSSPVAGKVLIFRVPVRKLE